MNLFLVVILSFLLGGIPTGYWLGKIVKGTDIRKSGSGNIGTTNAFRTLGKGLGLLTFVGDFLKGLVAIEISRMLSGGDALAIALSMCFTLFGHCFSPFLGFHGGKGVATICGVYAGVNFPLMAIGLSIFFLLLLVSRMVSFASVVTIGLAGPIIFLFFPLPLVIRIATLIISMLCVWRHRENIARILNGTERKIGAKHEK